MKYDIEKLRKVDFSKLKLDPVDTIQLAVGYNRTSVFIHSKETNVVILLREHDSDWQTNDGARFMSAQKIHAMFRRATEVDALIASELRRIEHEEYDVGEGWERVKDGEQFDEVINLDANPSRWVKFGDPCLSTYGNRRVFRRRKAPQVKLPTVKAPDGYSWMDRSVRGVNYRDGHSNIWLAKDNDCCGVPVPVDRGHRDAMAACVAAFDEANGVQSVEFETSEFEYSTSIHEPSGTLAIKGVGLTRFTEGLASMFPNGFTVKVTAKP